MEALVALSTDDEESGPRPYIGTGLSFAGHDSCGNDPQCPDVWLNLVFGFELHYRSHVSTGSSSTTGWTAVCAGKPHLHRSPSRRGGGTDRGGADG